MCLFPQCFSGLSVGFLKKLYLGNHITLGSYSPQVCKFEKLQVSLFPRDCHVYPVNTSSLEYLIGRRNDGKTMEQANFYPCWWECKLTQPSRKLALSGNARHNLHPPPTRSKPALRLTQRVAGWCVPETLFRNVGSMTDSNCPNGKQGQSLSVIGWTDTLLGSQQNADSLMGHQSQKGPVSTNSARKAG